MKTQFHALRISLGPQALAPQAGIQFPVPYQTKGAHKRWDISSTLLSWLTRIGLLSLFLSIL
jgi:hypothetical protein